LKPGQFVLDYEVIEELGRGGMGTVYKVRNSLTGRLEALKLRRADGREDSTAEKRFLQEIQICAELEHPNITALRTAFRWEMGQIAMVMELAEGASLEKRSGTDQLGERKTIMCILQVLQALSHAHRKGVIHRDIKPANIIVDSSGRAKLLDFGLAKDSYRGGLTTAGHVTGSLYYMSPEQILGEPIDHRTDIYSIGVTLYELVTGARPFEGPSDYSIIAGHLNTPPTPPILVSQGISRGLNEIILIAMNKDRTHRFQSADALHVALESVLPGAQKEPL
jgi:serine/threonine-protein kinase